MLKFLIKFIEKITSYPKKLYLLVRKIGVLARLFILDNSERKFIMFSENKWGSFKLFQNNNEAELLMETQHYHPYLFRSSYISNYFSRKYKLKIKTITPSWGANTTFVYKYFYRFTSIYKLLSSFGAEPGLNYYSLTIDEEKDCHDFAVKAFKSLRKKSDLLKVHIKDIPVGDLIYDSYLRRLGVPTVDLKDENLLKIIQGAFEIAVSCENYLKKHTVKYLIMSHAVYIEHGIIVRMCLKRAIDVFIFTSRDKQILRKLSLKHYLQTPNHFNYKLDFNKIEDQQKALLYARDCLEKRFSGVIDAGTSYMAKSAYSNEYNTENLVFDMNKKNTVVVFLHCFFDSPHVYSNMLFADFYDWLDFTLKTLTTTDFNILIKPHPNGLAGNEKIIEKFLHKYPTVALIDKTISNTQLAIEGFTAAVTVYGTIGHEFPYFGIPVIAAGDNPQISYSFCNTAKTVEEYIQKLKNPSELDRIFDKDEIEEFYYMHYLHEGYGRTKIDNSWLNFTKRTKNNVMDSSILSEFINRANSGEFDKIEGYFEAALNQFND